MDLKETLSVLRLPLANSYVPQSHIVGVELEAQREVCVRDTQMQVDQAVDSGFHLNRLMNFWSSWLLSNKLSSNHSVG